MKIKVLLSVLGLLVGLVGCARQEPAKTAATDRTIKLIMSDVGFNAEVAHVLKDEVAKQGYVLDWVVVNDIIQPNKLVDDGTADANSFQHEAYFDQFIQIAGYDTMISENGGFTKEGKKIFELSSPIQQYCVVPFGADELIPAFLNDVAGYKEGFKEVVKLYKLSSSYGK